MNFKTSNEIRRLSKEFCTAVTEYLMFDILRIILDHIPLYLRSKGIIKNDKKNESTNVNINKLREFLMRYLIYKSLIFISSEGILEWAV